MTSWRPVARTRAPEARPEAPVQRAGRVLARRPVGPGERPARPPARLASLRVATVREAAAVGAAAPGAAGTWARGRAAFPPPRVRVAKGAATASPDRCATRAATPPPRARCRARGRQRSPTSSACPFSSRWWAPVATASTSITRSATTSIWRSFRHRSAASAASRILSSARSTAADTGSRTFDWALFYDVRNGGCRA